MKTVFIQGHAFTGHPATRNTAFVDRHGIVSVADPVTGGRTTCHALTPAQIEQIKVARAYSTVTI